jgi:pimeloyl-ACP methyl ester carboxylesterase
MFRHMVMQAIRGDPAWQGGEYRSQPPGLLTALDTLFVMGSSPLQLQKQAPDRDAADRFLDGWLAGRLRQTDANDMLYQFDASRTYDPHPKLGSIKAPLVAVNSADDVINPPELVMAGLLVGRPLVPAQGLRHSPRSGRRHAAEAAPSPARRRCPASVVPVRRSQRIAWAR